LIFIVLRVAALAALAMFWEPVTKAVAAEAGILKLLVL
jgi:hypothetical protein